MGLLGGLMSGWGVARARGDVQWGVSCFFWGVDSCSETVQAGSAGIVDDDKAILLGIFIACFGLMGCVWGCY
jgi:hypothetical protein